MTRLLTLATTAVPTLVPTTRLKLLLLRLLDTAEFLLRLLVVGTYHFYTSGACPIRHNTNKFCARYWMKDWAKNYGYISAGDGFCTNL